MENRLIVTVFVIAAFVASSSALPARKRMVYYQQPAPYYAAPHHMMYVQYVQPAPNARSAQAASALVAGDTIATETYLEGCNHEESGIAAAAGPVVPKGEDVLSASGVHSAQSVAEAYPDQDNVAAPPSRDLTVQTESENSGSVVADLPTNEETDPQTLSLNNDDEAKVPRDYNFDANETAEPAPPAAESELPAPAPVVPFSPPARRYLSPKKKVHAAVEHSFETTDVELSNAENEIAVRDDEEVQEEEEVEEGGEEGVNVQPVVPVAPKKPVAGRRPVVKKPAKPSRPVQDCSSCAKAAPPGSSSKPKPQLPVGTFFPINFGGTAGGAIAIANSFSTGEGGSATSHAIAYGSPDAARGRVPPNKLQ